jgi:hypothetical protein
MNWLVPIVNVSLCAWLAGGALRKKRLISLYWLLATYFGLLLIRDMCLAPITYGPGYVQEVIQSARISQLAQFVLLCNLFFLAGERASFRLTAKRGPTLPALEKTSARSKHLFIFYAVIFGLGCIAYIPQAYSATYYDFVNNLIPGWRYVLFLAGLPAISICALQGRDALASIGCVACLVPVLTTQARVLVLPSVVTMLVIVAFRTRSAGTPHQTSVGKKAGLTMAGLLLLVLGAYVSYLRTGSLDLPEEGLPHGMYLICGLVDGGIAGTGNASLETVGKSLLFPFYNSFLTVDYTFPTDPATYTADIMMERPVVGGGFRHYPFLWYTDVYLAGAWYGAFLGLVWGFIIGLWEGAMAGRALLSAVFLPWFTWVLYMFFRGAAAATFHFASRYLYFHVLVLVVGGLYLQFVWIRGMNGFEWRPRDSQKG